MDMNIKTLSTTDARGQIGKLVATVAINGKPIIIGRRNRPEAVLIQFPEYFNGALSDIANINAYSRSFDFLNNEPELYSLNDIKK